MLLTAASLRAAALAQGGFAEPALNETLHCDCASGGGGGAVSLAALAPYVSLRAFWLHGAGAATLLPPASGWPPPLLALYLADNSLGSGGEAEPLRWLRGGGGDGGGGGAPALRILDVSGNALESLLPLGDTAAAATLTVRRRLTPAQSCSSARCAAAAAA